MQVERIGIVTQWHGEEGHLPSNQFLAQAGALRPVQGTSQALAIAQRQQAKSLELRIAVSLSRLWQHQGQRAAAYDLLAPIYGWFT